MKNLKPVWARNIKARRLELGFSSAEKFAEKLEMPYPTYRDIEGGVSEGGFDRRSAIAEALGWSVADLYKDNSKRNPNEGFNQAAALLSKYSSLSQKLQKIVWAIVFEDEELYDGLPADLKRALK